MNLPKINKDRLDEELLDQEELFITKSDRLAKAEHEVDKLEEDIAHLRARLILKAHREGLGEGVKLTEATVNAYVRSNKKYRRLKDAWLSAQAKMKRNKQDVFALNNRRSTLEALVKLHGQQYF
jgi:hypothetical protein